MKKTYVTYKGNLEILDRGGMAIHGTTIFSPDSPEYLAKKDRYPFVEVVQKTEPPPRLTHDRIQPFIERLGRISDQGWQFNQLALMELISLVEDEVRKDFTA